MKSQWKGIILLIAINMIASFIKEKPAPVLLQTKQAPPATTTTPAPTTPAPTTPAPTTTTAATTPVASTQTTATVPVSTLPSSQLPPATSSGPAASANPEDVEEDQFLSKKGIACDAKTNCPYPNTCLDATTCMCGQGFANYPFTGVGGRYCMYTQKKQLTAFLLELLLGMGIGHFSAGRTVPGVLKLLLALAPCILGIVFFCGALSFGSGGKGCVECCGLFATIMVYVTVIGYFAWTLADVILFGMNKYRDGNGVPLQHW